MEIKRHTRSGLVFVLALGILVVGACSQKKSRVDTTGVTSSGGDRSAAEEEEARRRAEAERRAAQERAAKEAGTQATARPAMNEIQAFESEAVYFDFDRSDIKPEHRPLLEKKAAWLKARPEYNLRIEGHCDERGTAEYNVALGEKRALSVKDYLVALGVPAKRMSTISYGEERPVVRGQDEAAWGKCRRAEFKLMK